MELDYGVMKPIMDDNTRFLVSGKATEADFGRAVFAYQAVAMKREGDLLGANEAYIRSFQLERSAQLSGGDVWGWAKLFMLAKDWKGLKDILAYHYAIMVAWNRLMLGQGNGDYLSQYKAMGMKPHFDFGGFDPSGYLREQTGCPLGDRDALERKFSSYGGSDYWYANYSISPYEFDEFEREFPN